jgi:hypothetical protein
MGFVGNAIYFADLTRGRVARLVPGNALEVLIEDIHCHSLAPGFDGNVYGEAVGTGRGGVGGVVGLWKISPDGSVEYVQPRSPTPEPGMWIALDGLGRSYSWHGEGERTSRIFRRSRDGEVSILTGGEHGFRDGPPGEAQFGAVGAIAATFDGILFVTDSGHLRRISPHGEVETVAANLVSERIGGLPGDFGLFNRSVGLAVDEEENVYAVDAYNFRVVRWHRARRGEVVWDSSDWLSRLTRGGLGWHPRGVAVNGADVYVLEEFGVPWVLAELIGSPRIIRISPGGHSETIIAVAGWRLRAAIAGLLAAIATWFTFRWRLAASRRLRPR